MNRYPAIGSEPKPKTASVDEYDKVCRMYNSVMRLSNWQAERQAELEVDKSRLLEYINVLIGGMTADQFNALVEAGKLDGIRAYLEGLENTDQEVSG